MMWGHKIVVQGFISYPLLDIRLCVSITLYDHDFRSYPSHMRQRQHQICQVYMMPSNAEELAQGHRVSTQQNTIQILSDRPQVPTLYLHKLSQYAANLGPASLRILPLAPWLCCLTDRSVRSNLQSAFSSRMKGLISLSQCHRHLCGKKKNPWSLPVALVAVSDRKLRFLCSDNDKDGHLGEAGYDSSEDPAFSLLTSQGRETQVLSSLHLVGQLVHGKHPFSISFP